MSSPQHLTLALRCPVCARALCLVAENNRPLVCAAGHRYDAAKQGYYNLLTGKGTAFREDTAAMVQARTDFLAAGHYSALAQAVAGMVVEATRGREHAMILDAGAGTGYYLAAALAAVRAAGTRPTAVAMDISRYAMRRAARLQDTTALVWDLWRPLPLADASVDILLNVFAPRNGAEYRRVLAPGGIAVVVTPLPQHLAEAAEHLGLLAIAGGKEESVSARLGDGFDHLKTTPLSFAMRLGAEDALRLALMGPAGHHLDGAGLRERLSGGMLPETVTAAFRVQVFRRR
ncbi:putative RNA methyltransferase [Arthrobacter sp. KK5.5]|uniref:putative RNA methyltransferase n=1 Tax=Arthrobacter sp. KK5.5 TaxID=3373084 RepID=UPI003EE7852D